MDFGLLMNLREYLDIKHHIPGRIRIKFALKLLSDPRAKSIKEQTEGETTPDCIKSTKVNLFTRNVIIEYDPDVIEPEILHEALTTSDKDRFDELARKLETVIHA